MAKKSEIQKEGLHSDYIEAENFQGLGKIRIDINGKSLLFIGKNDSGKSTLIRIMQSPMDTKQLPPDPIKKGEEHAKIVHKISGVINGEHKEYIMEMYFSQKDKKGKLVIKNEKGEILKAPATLIKSIIGNVSFDPRQWLNDPKAKKHETIKRISGVGDKVDEINAKIKALKDERKAKNDRAEDLRGSLKNHEFTQEEINKYSVQIDTAPLTQEMSAIGQKQNNWDSVSNQVNGFRQNEKNAHAGIQNAENEISRLKQAIVAQEQIMNQHKIDLSVAQENIAKGEDWMNRVIRPSVDDINSRINDAMVHNEKYARIGMLGNQQREMLKLLEEVEAWTSNINTLEEQKVDVISKSQLSIPGLTYTDEDLFIDGLPLDDKQINTARLWEIGIEVAKALNPMYKGIFLPDASLLDKSTFRRILQKIEKDGYFGIFEMVDFNEGPLHVEYAETIL